MDKSGKVTARDVAKEAGVSVATVSYIMNGRTDQKISPETRKKVLQIANLLNYVPSYAAKSLATGRSNAIGISFLPSSSPTRSAALASFIGLLTERINRLKYDVTFIPARRSEENPAINRNIDAIIAIDLDHSDFRSLADNYLVPVICVDMLVNDTLFYQIYEDIPFLVRKALPELGSPESYCFIYDAYFNSEYEDFILGLPGQALPLRQRELTPSVLAAACREQGYFIVNGAFLALQLYSRLMSGQAAPAGAVNTARSAFSPADAASRICAITAEKEVGLLPPGMKYIISNDDKKANLTMSILLNALKRNFDVTHDHPVR